jgi:arginine utilization regulatory protein
MFKLLFELSLRAILYYRLGVIQIQIPPLRERPEDILLLVEFFINKISLRLGNKIKGISPDGYGYSALYSLDRKRKGAGAYH